MSESLTKRMSDSLPAESVRGRSPLTSPLTALATVEVQLVMQCLPFSALVQFARCSRALLKQADTAFAFKYMPPLQVLMSSWITRKISRLANRAPITMFMNVTWTTRWLDTLPLKLDGLVMRCDATSSDVIELVAHPRVQQIRTLVLENDANIWRLAETFACIARLPHLQTLACVENGPFAKDTLRELHASTSLTDLTFCDNRASGPSSLEELGVIHNLVKVSVSHLHLFDRDQDRRAEIFLRLTRIQHLTLSYFDGVRLGVCNLSALRALHTLTLKGVRRVDDVLCRLPEIVTLRTLIIKLRGHISSAFVSHGVLLTLLTAMPPLQITIEFLNKQDHREYAEVLHAQFAVPARVEVRKRLTIR